MASFGPPQKTIQAKGKGSAGSRGQPKSGGQVRSPSGAKSAPAPRLSDRLNPKTIDPDNIPTDTPNRPISVGKASAWSRTVKQQHDRFQSQAPPMLVHKYVDENGSTTMLDTKRSAGVRAEFSTSKNKSAFANLYSNGAVPCRLVHGSVKHKLAWDSQPEQVSFDPVFLYLAQGLVETVHPYTFVARQGFKELLDTEQSADKVIPLLSKTTPHIRAALGHKEADVFEGALESLLKLSTVVGPNLNPHLKVLLVPISKRGMEKKYRDRVTEALMLLEQNGGKEALLTIKSKVPTYTSVIT